MRDEKIERDTVENFEIYWIFCNKYSPVLNIAGNFRKPFVSIVLYHLRLIMLA